jgi:hypothetical protein
LKLIFGSSFKNQLFPRAKLSSTKEDYVFILDLFGEFFYVFSHPRKEYQKMIKENM